MENHRSVMKLKFLRSSFNQVEEKNDNKHENFISFEVIYLTNNRN